MKAAVLTAYGAPELVRVVQTATPEASPGEVLVRVRASTVNRTEAAAAKAPAAAATTGHPAVGTPGTTSAVISGTPEALVALVLSELAEIRRELSIERT